MSRRSSERAIRMFVRRAARIATAAAAFLPQAAGSQSISWTSAVEGSGVADASCTTTSPLAAGEVTSEMRGEWPLAHITASGVVGSMTGGQQLSAMRAAGTVYTPVWRGWRVEAAFAREAEGTRCFSSLPESGEELRVSRGGRRQGFWLGYGAARGAWFETMRSAPGSDSTRYPLPVGAARTLTGGVWQNAGSLLVSLSFGSRSQGMLSTSRVQVGTSGPDSVYSDSAGRFVPAPLTPIYEQRTSRRSQRVLDTEVRLAWSMGEAAVELRAGSAFGRAGASGAQRWVASSASFALTPLLALTGELATQSAAAGERTFSHRRASLGVRLSTAPFSRSSSEPATPARAAVSEFRVRRVDAGSVLVSVRAPHARVVELSGDFLGWRPVRLYRSSADWWEVRVTMPSGPHRVNLRLDGAAWIAPPGVPVLKDEFGGEVGVIVAP